jgi:hypothetical protein
MTTQTTQPLSPPASFAGGIGIWGFAGGQFDESLILRVENSHNLKILTSSQNLKILSEFT